mgnify:CR=1 FL=1
MMYPTPGHKLSSHVLDQIGSLRGRFCDPLVYVPVLQARVVDNARRRKEFGFQSAPQSNLETNPFFRIHGQ